MSYYKHSVTEKSSDRLAEKQNMVLEARMELAPHTDFEKDRVYGVAGVGAFEGTYQFKKSTITLSPEGMKVEVEARMIFDGKPPAKAASPAPTKAETKKAPDKDYSVKSGDTLIDIARRLCKSPSDWKKIEEANRDLLVSRDKRNTSDKGHWIYPNMKLKIPSDLLK